MNKIVISGFVGNDLVLTGEGTKRRVNFGVFVQSPSNKDERIPLPVVAFGKTAEFIERYFAKGKAIELSGELSYGEWTTKDGEKRSSVNIIARDISFPPSNKETILGQGLQRERSGQSAPATPGNPAAPEASNQNQAEFFSQEMGQEGYNDFNFGSQEVPW